MERDELRLECLKLAVSKTNAQNEILARAEAYVEFVVDTAEPQTETVAAKAAPHTGNAKP